MWIFLVVILLLAALLEYLSLRGGAACLDGDFDLSKKRVEIGEELAITTTDTNRTRQPITNCTMRIAFPLSAVLPEGVNAVRDLYLCAVTDTFRLWGRQHLERRMVFTMGKRGVFTVTGRELSRGDFLGLQVQSERIDTRRSVIVYPARLESSALTEALGSYCGELTAQRWLLRDPVLTLGVREYTGTEPMHTISWTQTARRGELTVREFDWTRSLNCCVLLNVDGLSAQDDALLDRCCGAARTVCEALLAAGVEAETFTNAAIAGFPNRPYRSVSAGRDREEDLLDVLARVTSGHCSSAEALADACLEAQTDAAAYVLITPHADEAAHAALRILDAASGGGALLVAVDALEVD